MAADPAPSAGINSAITQIVIGPQSNGTAPALRNLLTKLDRRSSASAEATDFVASFIAAVNVSETPGREQLLAAIDALVEALDARYDARYAAIDHVHGG